LLLSTAFDSISSQSATTLNVSNVTLQKRLYIWQKEMRNRINHNHMLIILDLHTQRLQSLPTNGNNSTMLRKHLQECFGPGFQPQRTYIDSGEQDTKVVKDPCSRLV